MRAIVPLVACGLGIGQLASAPAAASLHALARTDLHGVRAPSAPLDSHVNAAAGDPRGTTGWQAIGPFGGDIDAIRPSPTNPHIVLAGLAPAGSSGGTLFRSTDSGNTWTRVLPMNGRSVYDITFTPAGRAYIGTDDGVWSSSDDGLTWVQHPLGIGLNDTVLRVYVDPTNPNAIWAGIAEHLGAQVVNLMRSPDGGTTWQNRTPPLASPMTCNGIAIDPNNANNVYACFAGGLGGGQFWYSSNGGTTWQNRSAGLPNRPLNDVVHDGTRVLVGGGQQFGSQSVGLYQSVNHGVTWTPLHSGWPNLFVTDVEIDPSNPMNLYVTTLGSGVFRSTNGGASWSFGYGGSNGLSLNAVHVASSSPEHLYAGGSSVGVLQSDNGGNFVATATGIDSLDVFSIAASDMTGEIAIAFQSLNSGGVYTSDNGGQSWELEPLPGTRYSAVEFAPNGTLYAISSGPTTVAQEGVYRRNANGSWTLLGPNQGSFFESELFALEFSQNNPNLIFASGADFGNAGFEQTIWRSTDAGMSWTKVYEGLANRRVTDVVIIEDGTDQTLVASFSDFSGTNSGGALRSTDGGTTWEPASSGVPALFQGSELCASPENPEALYMSNSLIPTGSGNRGLYHSTDAGDTWVPANGITVPLTGVSCDEQDASVLYGINSAQIAVRIQGQGASFELLNTGLSGLFPRDIAYTIGDGRRLLLATNRGSFVLPLGLPGDMNCDGVLTVADIAGFVLALTDPAGYAAAFPNCDINNADINNDGMVTVSDIGLFVQLLTGG